jgi:hypothetical protein
MASSDIPPSEFLRKCRRRGLPQNVAGQRFGRLTAVGFAQKNRVGTWWLFRCECGTEKVLLQNVVMRGRIKSCGCLYRDSRGLTHRTHGQTKHPLMSVFKGMMQRCYNPNFKAFKDYGARGIDVCQEWRGDRSRFIKWGEANGYEAGLDIDRRDNNKGYSEHNCRFVTRKVNTNNHRRNRRVTFRGRSLTIAELSRETGLNYGTLLSRIKRQKWDAETAVTMSVEEGRKMATAKMHAWHRHRAKPRRKLQGRDER